MLDFACACFVFCFFLYIFLKAPASLLPTLGYTAAALLLKTKPEALGGPAAKTPVVSKDPQEAVVEQVRSKKATVRKKTTVVFNTYLVERRR